MVGGAAQELCTGCAFLGERDGHGDVVEALPAYRQAPSTTQNRNDRSGGTPVCIMGKRSFRAEYDVLYSRLTRERPGYGINSQEAIQEVLSTPPDCGTWEQYLEGITPKERREMLDRQWQIEQEGKRHRADRRARQQELKIARGAANASRSAARWQAVAAVLTGVAIAVTAGIAILKDDRPVIVNYPNGPVLTTPAAAPPK